MARYVDGFVIPVPKDRIEAYRKLAETAAAVWKEHGALDYWECVGDELEVQDQVSFPELANARPDETVVFAWIVYESKESRNEILGKIRADPRLKDVMDASGPVFDAKRMAYGGFRQLVHT